MLKNKEMEDKDKLLDTDVCIYSRLSTGLFYYISMQIMHTHSIVNGGGDKSPSWYILCVSLKKQIIQIHCLVSRL